MKEFKSQEVFIPINAVDIHGDLTLSEGCKAIVLFAHGSGSSRHSPRNKSVARFLNEGGIATLLVDLLTSEEETIDASTAHLRFDVALLARRLERATDWVRRQSM